MDQLNSPFKFLDAYSVEDEDIFFGREAEIEELYNALRGVKHLLVYGPSGSGKTSLIECGLRNEFSDADWFALTIRRQSNMIASVFQSIDNFLEEKLELQVETGLPASKSTNFPNAVERLFNERYQPIYLLFDQFEELLISGSTTEKETFFRELNGLIKYKIPCRIILIMREEFIGHLSQFESFCPSIFQYRYRLEKMRTENVGKVILQTLSAQRFQTSFTVEEPEVLKKEILAKLPDNHKEIELTHVQVFLDELWDRAKQNTPSQGVPILHQGLIKKEDDLEGILDSFLKKQLKLLAPKRGEKIPLELLATMISKKHTKLQLSYSELQQSLSKRGLHIPSQLSSLLEDLHDRRLIRTLKSGDNTQYEISHDMLALVVGQNLTKEMQMRERAEEIYQLYFGRTSVFSPEELDILRPLKEYKAYPPALKALVLKSKKEHDREQEKTKRQLRRVIGLLFVAIIGLSFAIYSYDKANKAYAEAKEAKQEAIDQADMAKQARDNAQNQEKIANSAKSDAVLARAKAEQQKERAEDALAEAQRLLKYFSFNDYNTAWAFQDGKIGLIDSFGNPISAENNFIYENPSPFRNGISIVSVDNKKVLLSFTGQELSPRYEQIQYVAPNRYTTGQEWYTAERLLATPKVTFYQEIVPDLENKTKLTRARKNDRWGYIDMQNEVVIPVINEKAGKFSEELAKVKDRRGWFFIDQRQNRLTSNYYEDAKDFSNGFALVKNKRGYFYIDRQERKLTEHYFDFATSFNDSYAQVFFNNEYKIIDEDGEFTSAAPFQKVFLGDVDQGHIPEDISDFYKGINKTLPIQFVNKGLKSKSGWHKLKQREGGFVSHIQNQLELIGFLPQISNTGIFDYNTQSALRLFQEFTNANISDGQCDLATFQKLINFDPSTPKQLLRKSTEYNFWIDFLHKVNGHYSELVQAGLFQDEANKYNDTDEVIDTRSLKNWSFDPSHIHIIGIRRNEDVSTPKRENDDIFILLVQGMVFKFWGSTDPNAKFARRENAAFWMEGQHELRPGWSKIGDTRGVYQALIPNSRGVLAYRDQDGDNALTIEDIKGGVFPPNPTLGLHWSGIGLSNWNGGSQVIAGGSYINNQGKLILCSSAARAHSQLDQEHTKGAYDIFMDLVTIFSQKDEAKIFYTLIHEKVLRIAPSLGNSYVDSTYSAMAKPILGPRLPIPKSSTSYPKYVYRKEYEDIFKEIKKLLVEKLGVSAEDVEWDTHFTLDLGANELDTVKIEVALQKSYSVDIPENSMFASNSLDTVQKLVVYLYQATHRN